MKFILPIAACAAAIGGTPALAEPASGTRSQVVNYADLDLRTEAGLEALDRRIRVAVREACGTASNADLRGRNAVRRCRTLTSKLVAASRSQAIASARRPSSTELASEK